MSSRPATPSTSRWCRMRKGRASLDRDSDRQAFGGPWRRQRRARAWLAAPAQALKRCASSPRSLRSSRRSPRRRAPSRMRRWCGRSPPTARCWQKPPAELRLTFNEPVSPLVMRLIGPAGEVIAPAVEGREHGRHRDATAIAARHACAELACGVGRRPSGRRLAHLLGRRGRVRRPPPSVQAATHSCVPRSGP